MDREDSGVIDLLAIHARSTAALESTAPPPPDPPSTPPSPVTMDVAGLDESSSLEDLDDLDVPFRTKSRRTPVFVAMGVAVVAIVGIVGVASMGGSDDGSAPKVAAAKIDPVPPPPAAVPLPPPPTVERSTPAPAPAPSAKAARPRAPQPVFAGGPRPGAAPPEGPKLMKVQSAGIP